MVRRPIPQSRSYVKYARDSPLCKGAMMKRRMNCTQLVLQCIEEKRVCPSSVMRTTNPRRTLASLEKGGGENSQNFRRWDSVAEGKAYSRL